MGLEVVAPRRELPSLPALVEEIRAAVPEAVVVMADGVFLAPGKPVPEAWSDVRVRTPAGTVTLARREGGIAVVVFGNADEPLREAQGALAQALSR